VHVDRAGTRAAIGPMGRCSGPHGEKVEAEGGEPVSALAALARLLVPIRGTMSG